MYKGTKFTFSLKILEKDKVKVRQCLEQCSDEPWFIEAIKRVIKDENNYTKC